jgi:hypothetical protein
MGVQRGPRLGIEKGICLCDVALPRLECRWATFDVLKLSPARFRLSPGCQLSRV